MNDVGTSAKNGLNRRNLNKEVQRLGFGCGKLVMFFKSLKVKYLIINT